MEAISYNVPLTPLETLVHDLSILPIPDIVAVTIVPFLERMSLAELVPDKLRYPPVCSRSIPSSIFHFTPCSAVRNSISSCPEIIFFMLSRSQWYSHTRSFHAIFYLLINILPPGPAGCSWCHHRPFQRTYEYVGTFIAEDIFQASADGPLPTLSRLDIFWPNPAYRISPTRRKFHRSHSLRFSNNFSDSCAEYQHFFLDFLNLSF